VRAGGELAESVWLERFCGELSGLLANLCLGRDADRNRLLWDGFGSQRHGAEHSVFADVGSGEYGGVIRDAGARPELSHLVGDVRLVVDVVGVRVDVGVVGDAGSFVQDDLAAIVEQDVLVDGAGVFDGEVVAVGELDVVEDFDVLAEVPEDVAAKHAAEAEAEPVVQAEGGAVEHLPEPDERLADGVLLGVYVTVVLRFERDVAGVEALGQGVHGELAVEHGLDVPAVGTAEVDLVEFVADDLGAAFGRLLPGELVVEFGEPATVEGLSFGSGFEFAVCMDWHGSLADVRPVEDWRNLWFAYSMAKTA
jgi:hypothetical protein